MIFLIILLSAAAICAIIYGVYEKKQSARILKRLDDMIQRAIDGEFPEEDYDESLLSSVEAKFAKYLSASFGTAIFPPLSPFY